MSFWNKTRRLLSGEQFVEDAKDFADEVGDALAAAEDLYNDLFAEQPKTTILEHSVKTTEHSYPLIYGETSIGGAIVWYGSSKREGNDGDDDEQEFLHMVVAICEGDIQAIDKIIINDYEHTDPVFLDADGVSYLQTHVKLGSENQTAFAELLSASSSYQLGWRDSDSLNGLACVHLRMERRESMGSDDPFGSGIPTIKFKLRGRRVRRIAGVDYGNTSNHYSTNPIECYLDYLQHRAGAALDVYSKLGPHWAEWKAAAEACNTPVLNNGESRPLFNLNLVVDTGQEVGKNLRIIEKHIRARAGVTYLRPPVMDIGRAPAAILTEDDLAGLPVIATPARSERYNRISVQYRNINDDGESNTLDAVFPESGNALAATWLAEDGNQPNERSERLVGINNAADALRMARYLAYRSRTERVLVISVRPHLFGLTPGDVLDINFTDLGGRYLVTKFDRETLTANIVEQVPESIDDAAVTTIDPPPPTQIPDPTELQPPGLQAISHQVKRFTPATTAGELSTVELTLQPQTAGEVYSYAEVRYKTDAANAWIEATGNADPLFEIVQNHKNHQTLIVQARPVSRWGKKGSWQRKATIDLGAWASPDLPLITGLTLDSFIGREARISWAPLLPRPEWLRDYVFQVVDLGVQPAPDTVLFETSTADDHFIISEDIIRTQNLTRDMVVRVMPRAMHGLTGTPSDLAISNPKPAAPTAISITAKVNRVELAWTPAAGDIDFIGTRIYYRKGSSGSFNELTLNAHSTDYVLNNLDSNSAYQVKLASIDAFGDGDSSAVLFATTQKPLKPLSLVATPGVNETALTLTAPGEYQGIKLWYGDNLVPSGEPIYNGRDLSINLPGQLQGTTHYIYYRAIDGKGVQSDDLVGPVTFTTKQLTAPDISGLSPWATKNDPANKQWMLDHLAGDAIPSTLIENVTAAKLSAGIITSELGIQSGGSIETVNSGYKAGMGVYDDNGVIYTFVSMNDQGDLMAGITADGKLVAKNAEIAGKVTIGSGSSGYGGLVDKPQATGFYDAFEGDISGWENYSGSGEIEVVNSPTSNSGKVMRIGNNAGSDMAWLIHKEKLPFNRNVFNKISIRIRREIGAGSFYIGLAGYDANGNFVNINGGNSFSNQHYFCLANHQPVDDLWHEYQGIFKGTSSTGGNFSRNFDNPSRFHPNVVYFSPLILVNFNNRAGIVEIDEIKIETIPDAMRWEDIESPNKPADGADVTDYAAAQASAESYTNGEIDTLAAASQTAIDNAQAAAQSAAEITAAAYADDIVTAEEQRAIADASAKANAAEWAATSAAADLAEAARIASYSDDLNQYQGTAIPNNKVVRAASATNTAEAGELFKIGQWRVSSTYSTINIKGKAQRGASGRYEHGFDFVINVTISGLFDAISTKSFTTQGNSTSGKFRVFYEITATDVLVTIYSHQTLAWNGLYLSADWFSRNGVFTLWQKGEPLGLDYVIPGTEILPIRNRGVADNSDVTKTVIDNGLITTGSIELKNNVGAGYYGKIRSGKTSAADSTPGFWMASTVDGAEFNLGSASEYLAFNQTDGLNIKGNVTIVGGSGYSNLSDTPNSLGDINSAEAERLDSAITFKVASKGFSVSGLAGLFDSHGELIAFPNRSYKVSIWDRINSTWLSHTQYDVYASTPAAAEMAAALNALDNTKIVVIFTHDEPKLHRLDDNLPEALYRCGASSLVFGSSEFKRRGAYILIGIPGIGEGSGAEYYAGEIDDDSNAKIEAAFTITKTNNSNFDTLVASSGTTALNIADGADVTDYVTIGNDIASAQAAAEAAAALDATAKANAAEAAAEAAAAIDASNKANAAQTAAEADATAKANAAKIAAQAAAETNAAAYADNIVTAEEQRAINDATSKANAAQAAAETAAALDATSKANAAEAAAEAAAAIDASTKANAAQAAAEADATAKANAAQAAAAADATSKANAAKAAAQSAAETTAAAYADGIVTAAEQRAINDATAKANAAQVAAQNAAAIDATTKANTAQGNAIAATVGLDLVASSNMELVGLSAKKLGGNFWAEQVYSKQSYIGGAAVTVTNKSTNENYMVGLNTDPSANASYSSIDYALFVKESTYDVYESAVNRGVVLNVKPAIGDVVSIQYDGINVRYLINGVVCRTVAAPANLKLYFDSSYSTNGAAIDSIQFTPLTNLYQAAKKEIESSISLNSGGLIMSGNDVAIRASKANFADSTAGIWVGKEGGKGKINVGNAASHLKFDGTNAIDLKGKVTITSGSSGFNQFSDKPADADMLNYSSEGSLTRISRPGGAAYSNDLNNQTGAIKIALPQYFSSTMLKFTIDIYDYATGKTIAIEVGGYNYAGNGGYWINCSATTIGGYSRPIRFGHDGSKCCIWIGNTNHIWQYPKVSVRDFSAGYGSNSGVDKWNAGWNISLVTTIGTYNQEFENTHSDVTKTIIDGGLITTGAINLNNNVGAGQYGKIHSGKNSVIDTAAGFWLASTVDGAELNLGNSSQYLTFDNSSGLTIQTPQFSLANGTASFSGRILGAGGYFRVEQNGQTSAAAITGAPATCIASVLSVNNGVAGLVSHSVYDVGLFAGSQHQEAGQFRTQASRTSGKPVVSLNAISGAAHIQMLTSHRYFPTAENGAIIRGHNAHGTDNIFVRVRGAWRYLNWSGNWADGALVT